MGRVSKLVVHHFYRPDVPANASRATERSVMRGVEAFHAAKGWSAAPGYTFVVFDSGRVYESTGWGRRGVHTAGQNSSAIAFCFGIDGDADNATSRAWAGMAELAALGVAQGHLSESYGLYGHRDFAAKSCPGNKVYPHIGRVRSGRIPDDGGDEMRKGDNDNAVEILQRRLNDVFNAKLTVDGDYGPSTAAAVESAQRELGFARTPDIAHGMFQAALYLASHGLNPARVGKLHRSDHDHMTRPTLVLPDEPVSVVIEDDAGTP